MTMNYPQRHQENTRGKTLDLNAKQRVNLALTNRAQGMSWDEVASMSGYKSRGAAHNAVRRELAQITAANVEDMRREEALILSKLHERCMKAALDERNKGFLFAVDRVIAIRERWSKLFGLDVPVENAIAANMVVIREMPQGYLGLEQPAQ